jgi:hypothetical protein
LQKKHWIIFLQDRFHPNHRESHKSPRPLKVMEEHVSNQRLTEMDKTLPNTVEQEQLSICLQKPKMYSVLSAI